MPACTDDGCWDVMNVGGCTRTTYKYLFKTREREYIATGTAATLVTVYPSGQNPKKTVELVMRVSHLQQGYACDERLRRWDADILNLNDLFIIT